MSMEPKELYLPIMRWKDHFLWPTLNGMRERYRRRKELGFESAFFRDGRLIIVKVNEFWLCMEKKGEKNEPK
jgi:hypothetical protein